MFSRSPNRLSPILASAAALFLLFTAGMSAALPEDRDQPIHITADQALRDEKQGFTLYEGNVKMSQGSLQIEADELTIYHVAEGPEKIVARGHPARLQQIPDPAKGPVQAHAEIIEYFKNEDRVLLTTDARIEQDGSIVAGDSIDYFISEQRVRANSDQAREDSRVQVVIPAQTLQQDDREGSGTTDSE
jgi:lipopolysaccharide export system protein LptA